MESSLRLAHFGNIALLQLENPLGYPRLESALLENLLRELSMLRAERELEGIVVTGTPHAFAAGAEIAEVAALTPLDAVRFSRFGQSVMQCIERFPKPIIAAIRGYCIGGGLDLALACHLRIVGDDAVFAHPGGSLGIITGWGGTARLPRIIGRARALELLSTGCTMRATEAYAAHLVSRVVPAENVVEAAFKLLRRRSRKRG